MENIKISKVCGLCAGCKFAIDTAIKELQSSKKVTLFKEIVHNNNVNSMLQNKGIIFETSLNALKPSEKVIIRAHGEPKSTYEFLESNQIPFVDCTCVNVKKIHEQVELFSKNGYQIIIIGKYGKKSGVMHPEIVGTVGWCESEPILIEDSDDLLKIKNHNGKKFYLVCQTTFNMEKADILINNISNICDKNHHELVVNKSICMAQKQINIFSVKLAEECDLMIVVGGKNSSNSLELFNNVKNYTKSIFIENIHDYESALAQNNISLSKNMKIGLTAGASTIKSELEELKILLQNKLKELD